MGAKVRPQHQPSLDTAGDHPGPVFRIPSQGWCFQIHCPLHARQIKHFASSAICEAGEQCPCSWQVLKGGILHPWKVHPTVHVEGNICTMLSPGFHLQQFPVASTNSSGYKPKVSCWFLVFSMTPLPLNPWLQNHPLPSSKQWSSGSIKLKKTQHGWNYHSRVIGNSRCWLSLLSSRWRTSKYIRSHHQRWQK